MLRHYRGINETIASLLMSYIAIAIMNFFVEGALRDPGNPNKPSTLPIGDANMIGEVPGLGVHWGLPVGIVVAVVLWVLMNRTTFGFAARVTGGNVRAARAQGLPVGKLMVIACAIAGACAGLAGFFEVAAIQGKANASLAAGYGFTGILVAFLARQNPLAIVPVVDLPRRHRRGRRADPAPHGHAGRHGAGAAGADVRRAAGQRDALWPASLLPAERRQAMNETDIGLWGVPLAMFAGAIRVSTPFLFVSLGECLTEKSGRINLGLEGTLVFGAMSGYAISYLTGSPWLGVLAAGISGCFFGAIHGYICKLPKVNDIAIGIAMMLFGTGLAFFFGKPFIQPQAPHLPSIHLGGWSELSAGPVGAGDQPAVPRRHRAGRRRCGGRSRTRAGASSSA